MRTRARELWLLHTRPGPVLVRGLAALLLLILLPSGCSRIRGNRPLNVVIVTFDTTCAAHVGHLGHTRDTTPHLDRVASEGVSFLRAYSTSTWTAPSHASIFTGLHPSRHGCHVFLGEGDRPRALRPGVLTLQEVLQGRGYATAGFIGGPYLSSLFGFDRGFDLYDDQLGETERLSAAVNRLAFDWLDTKPPETPFFLFLNYFDPHGPYTPRDDLQYPFGPPPGNEQTVANWWFSPGNAKREHLAMPSDDEIPALLERYDQEIFATDHALGELIARLRERGVWDDTILVVTSDHGESFGWKDGKSPIWGHGAKPFENQCHVPLVLRVPGLEDRKRGMQVEGPVSNVDVAPTVMAILGGESGLPYPERNLLDPEATPTSPGVAFAERYFNKKYCTAFWKDQFKLMSTMSPDDARVSERLVALGETESGPRFIPVSRLEEGTGIPANLLERARDVVADLRRSRSEHIEAHGGPVPPDFTSPDTAGNPEEMNPGLREMLEKMGYLKKK